MHRRFISHQRKRFSNKKKALTRSVSRTAKKPMTDVSMKSRHEGGALRRNNLGWRVRTASPRVFGLDVCSRHGKVADALEKGAVHQLGVFGESY